MPNREDKGIKVLVANAMGRLDKAGYTDEDLKCAVAEIQELASNPTPDNRYKIGQIMAYAVDEIMAEKETWLERIADTITIPMDGEARFKVDLDAVEAYIQAEGATTPRSKMFNKYINVDTVEVSARPYVNYMELATGKVDFTKLLNSAANEMIAKKVAYIDKVLTRAAALMQNGAYDSGADIVKPTFDNLLHKLQRVGKVTILGDIAELAKLSGVAGWNGNGLPSDEMQNELMKNGYIGNYLGADVVRYNAPLEKGTLNPLVDYKWIWMLVEGADSPLKVVERGAVQSLDQTNIDDFSYEVVLRQNFGAAFVLGNTPTLGAYEDTSV